MDQKNSEYRQFLRNVGVYLGPYLTFIMKRLAKNVTAIFAKKLHHRSLTRSEIQSDISYLFKAYFNFVPIK